jgi:hypothetical protein
MHLLKSSVVKHCLKSYIYDVTSGICIPYRNEYAINRKRDSVNKLGVDVTGWDFNYYQISNRKLEVSGVRGANSEASPLSARL